MKNFRIVLVVLLMAFVLPIFAQPTESEFLGKWDLMVRDLPDGDAEMHLHIYMKDGKLTGVLTGGKEVFPLYDVEIDGDELNYMYDARGHNIPVNIELLGDGKCEGYMIDMFLIEGVKVKEEAKEEVKE